MPDPVIEAMDRFRGSLDSLDVEQRRTLLGAYRSGWNSIQQELAGLWQRVETAPQIPVIAGDGTRTMATPPSWLFQQNRYIALQGEVRGLVAGVSSSLGQTMDDSLSRGWTLGGQEATAAGVNLAEIPIRSWAAVPQRSFQAFVGGASTGPLASLLQGFTATNGPQAAVFARDVLGAGLLRGRSAFAVADDLTEGLQNLTYARALRIARTETLRAYREGARQNYLANREIVQSWTWRAAVENSKRPPCGACFARHGSIHPLSEPMQTHPNCRCRMVPNRSPVLGISPRNPVLPDAQAAFDALPFTTQRRILGPSRLEMYRAGRVKLTDFATTRARGPWGANDATLRPLSELRSLTHQGRALPAAADRLFRQASAAEGEVSAALQRVGHRNGAALEGFGYRLKAPDRIAEKIRTDVIDGKGLIVKASEGINDALRYTYRLETGRYSKTIPELIRGLQAEGMTVVKTKNFWQAESGYRGYHAIMRAPSGARFELQFHTAKSLAVKERSHVLYDIQRLDRTLPAEKLRLQTEIDELWAGLRAPAGVKKIPDDWPAVTMSADDYLALIRRTEDELVGNRDFETAVVFDSQNLGRIVLDKRGAQYDVEFTTAEEAAMRGNLLTHNHPRAWGRPYPDGSFPAGSSFSTVDIDFMLRNRLGGIRAASNGWRHESRPGSAWTGSPEQFAQLREEIYAAERRVRDEMNAAIAIARREGNELLRQSMGTAARDLSAREIADLRQRAWALMEKATIDAEFEHFHLVWTYVSRATDFITYERVAR